MKSRATILLSTFLALAAAVFALAGPASAHDSLKSSTPAKDAVVAGLDQIELEFSAHVQFPVVVLHDDGGRSFSSGKPRTSGSKVFQQVAGPLPSGTYTIAWRVVSSDGHPVEGEIPFTVQNPSNPAAPASVSTSTAAPIADQGTGVPGWIWGGALLLVLAGAVAASMFGGRDRRRTDDVSS